MKTADIWIGEVYYRGKRGRGYITSTGRRIRIDEKGLPDRQYGRVRHTICKFTYLNDDDTPMVYEDNEWNRKRNRAGEIKTGTCDAREVVSVEFHERQVVEQRAKREEHERRVKVVADYCEQLYAALSTYLGIEEKDGVTVQAYYDAETDSAALSAISFSNGNEFTAATLLCNLVNASE